jgi:branched-chain amino acid transport system substrate-binding protein
VLPQATLAGRGYKGRVYQTTGVTNADFIRVGGKAVESTFVAAAPVVVADELPPKHPARGPALELKQIYEKAYGEGSLNSFAGYAWDAWLIARDALARVGDRATPGTPEFRKALRDALEASKSVATTNGLVTMSPEDHNGFNSDAPVMIKVRAGKWTIAR